jgi:hypothetical protein
MPDATNKRVAVSIKLPFFQRLSPTITLAKISSKILGTEKEYRRTKTKSEAIINLIDL